MQVVLAMGRPMGMFGGGQGRPEQGQGWPQVPLVDLLGHGEELEG